MKKILLLSDTHSYIDGRILHHAEKADEIWHAGDIGNLKVTDLLGQKNKLRGVYGNIDDEEARRTFPLDNRFTLEGVDVWMTHIGGYPGRYDRRIFNEINQNPPDLFISGHSHILKVMRDKKRNLMHFNPGAAGNHGFHKVRTMIRFELNNGKIENPEVIELAKRGK
jgi:hypothetical protein